MIQRIFAIIFAALLPLAAQTAEKPEFESWVYWLQDISVEQLVNSPAELAVIDYSRDGSDTERFTLPEISEISESGTLPVAYLSIGEAENYRFYWKERWEPGNPGFIGPENPDWTGNFKVRYWKELWWKTALRPYLDRIIRAGFKGVYLDIIDAYWYWSEQGMRSEITARRMVRLVERIARYCRARAGDEFLIIPQNGLSILDDAGPRYKKRYLRVISAVGVEDLFFHFYSRQDQAYRQHLLAEINAAGLQGLSVEYVLPKRRRNYLRFITKSGLDLVPYRAQPNRALDELNSR